MFVDDKKYESVHTSAWPTICEERINEEENNGEIIIAIIGEIRRDKAENQKPLNTPIRTLTFYSKDKKIQDIINQTKQDLVGICKIEKLKIKLNNGEGREVQGYPSIRFEAEY